MKRSIVLILVATATLLACGKSEESAVTPPALDVPQTAETAPVESAPIQPAPVADAAPATAPVDTPAVAQPVALPAAPTKTQTPAAAKPAPVPVTSAPAVVKPTPAPIVPAPVEAAPSTPKPDLARGQQIYRQACAFCHDKGIAGAPKLGDATTWAPRLAQGIDTLYSTAIRGKGAMPAKGGNPALSDADVKAAVDFMAAQAR